MNAVQRVAIAVFTKSVGNVRYPYSTIGNLTAKVAPRERCHQIVSDSLWNVLPPVFDPAITIKPLEERLDERTAEPNPLTVGPSSVFN